MTEPVTVTRIMTRQARAGGMNNGWYARCYSTRLGYMEQWGSTDLEARRKLYHFVVDVQGDLWPAVEQGV